MPQKGGRYIHRGYCNLCSEGFVWRDTKVQCEQDVALHFRVFHTANRKPHLYQVQSVERDKVRYG